MTWRYTYVLRLRQVGYDQLVVAAGLQINWGKIKGLPETIGACVRASVYGCMR